MSGCAKTGTKQINFPSAVDVEAVTASKPRPTPDILKSSKAADEYNAAVETWGEGLQSAGKRLCTWFNDRGGKFNCNIK